MLNKILIGLFLIVFQTQSVSDEVILVTWYDLEIVKLKEKFYESEGIFLLSPIFSEETKKLDKQYIEMKGILTVHHDTSIHKAHSDIFHKFNFPKNGYMCGESGQNPNEIMNIFFDHSKYAFTQKDTIIKDIKIQGRLNLNSDNIDLTFFWMDDIKIIQN